eukprot:COSAG01_NODE_5832_length_4006_cov_572.675710_3_plen_136_part_00
MTTAHQTQPHRHPHTAPAHMARTATAHAQITSPLLMKPVSEVCLRGFPQVLAFNAIFWGDKLSRNQAEQFCPYDLLYKFENRNSEFCMMQKLVFTTNSFVFGKERRAHRGTKSTNTSVNTIIGRQGLSLRRSWFG